MADGTKIEWTDATWTPVKGCTRVSPGCGGPGKAGGCYAEIMAARFSKPGQWGEGLAKIVTLPDGSKDHRWTGEVRFDENELLKPLSWKTPRKIFVCSTADLFHEKVEDDWIDQVFAIMALCPQHTFQVLTKRPERMRQYMDSIDNGDGERLEGLRDALVEGTAQKIYHDRTGDDTVAEWLAVHLPLPNVWLGTSVEDQPRANDRIPHLIATPAVIRFLSCEPLLGPVDLTRVQRFPQSTKEFINAIAGRMWTDQSGLPNPDPRWDYPGFPFSNGDRGLHWVIAGGESGPGARPMHPDWARDLRDQCAEAGVPFFMKQWGEWVPGESIDPRHIMKRAETGAHWFDGRWSYQDYTPGQSEELHTDDAPDLWRVGKRNATRFLDGVVHDGFPETAHV